MDEIVSNLILMEKEIDKLIATVSVVVVLPVVGMDLVISYAQG